MSLTLIKSGVDNDHRVATATYRLEHSTPGRGGTCLSLNVEMESGFGRIKARVPDLAPEVESSDPELALDKLADWMERAAEAIRKRGTASAVFNQYKPE